MEIPELPSSAILLVEVGSTAHGTGIPGGEDHDQLGIVVEPAAEVLGLDPLGFRTVMQRTQPEGSRSGPGDIDRTLHSLRRFVRLAASGNPSILMAFWSPIEFATDEGRSLRDLGDAFVGAHVVPRYRGYMRAQAMRLLGLRGGRRLDVGVGGRPELVAAHGYDTKFAMHSARLGFQGLELLRNGKLEFPIQGEPASWLRAVRHGEVGFDEWWARALELDADLGHVADDRSLRPGPDVERIERWTVETHLRVWAEGTKGATWVVSPAS